MIKFEKVILLDNKEPLDLTLNNGIHFFDYENKYIFELLSLKNQTIKKGNFLVDDFYVFPLTDPRKYAFVLNINSQVINVNAVFILPLSLKDKTRSSLKKSLILLKDMPLENDEDKQNKIKSILSILKSFNSSYVLLDLNDEINNINNVLIKTVIEDEFNDFNIFVLNQKIIQLVNEEINLHDVVEDDDVYEIEVTQEIKKEQIQEKLNVNNNEYPDYSKEFLNFDKPLNTLPLSTKKDKFYYWFMFSKQLFKFNYLYYLFIALFSIFLSVCSLSSIYLIRTDNVLISVILIVLNIVFLIMNAYILSSTAAGMKIHLNNWSKKITFICYFVLFSIIGFAIGFGITYLMSIKDIFVNFNEFTFNDYILSIVVGVITLILPIFSIPLAKVYVYLKTKLSSKKNI